MSLDLEPSATAPKSAPPTTVWVRTGTGLIETTMPRPAATFIAGVGKPGAADGADGSIYLDTATGTFYGPRLGILWPTIGRLQNVPKDEP